MQVGLDGLEKKTQSWVGREEGRIWEAWGGVVDMIRGHCVKLSKC